MGSLVYAERCKERGDAIVAAVSLETIGFFSDVKGSQQYPPPFGLVYPSEGNFIGVIGNIESRGLTRQVIRAFVLLPKFPAKAVHYQKSFLASVGLITGHSGNVDTLES